MERWKQDLDRWLTTEPEDDDAVDDPCLDVAAVAPPGDVAAAVALFAERYPALGERPWAEILGDIIDDDAYRGIVDPMWAGNRRTQIDRNGVAPWVNAAALTVYYVNVAKGQDTPPRFHAVMTLAIAARRQSGLEEVVT